MIAFVAFTWPALATADRSYVANSMARIRGSRATDAIVSPIAFARRKRAGGAARRLASLPT
jgi:hypothetical protein